MDEIYVFSHQNAKNFATISGHAILGLLPNQIQRYVAGKLYDDKSKAHEISFQSSLVEGTIGTGMLIGTEYSLVTDLLTNHTGGPYVLASMVVFASGFARAALVKSDYSNNSSNGTGHPILGAIYHPCQLAVKTITQYIPNITRAITGKITNIYRNKEQELLSSNETKLLEEENPKSSN